MANLFEKIEGISTSTTTNSIVDTEKTFEVNKYKGWQCVLIYTLDDVENIFNIKIASNTSTEIVLTEEIEFPQEVDYYISFVNRFNLNEIESDTINTLKITDDLINFK